MKPNEPEMEVGWDGRQVFIYQMGKREDLVLDASYHDPKHWYETVRDYFDCVACAFTQTEEDDYDNMLNEIETLLFGKLTKEGYIKTQADKDSDNNKAYPKLRKIMRDMKRKLWLQGLYMPRYEKKDPSKAIMDMGD